MPPEVTSERSEGKADERVSLGPLARLLRSAGVTVRCVDPHGRPADDASTHLFDRVHPDDVEMLRAWLARADGSVLVVRRACDEGFRSETLHVDREERDGAEVRLVVAIAGDHDDAEARRLAALLRSTTDTLCTLDRDLQVQSVHPGASADVEFPAEWWCGAVFDEERVHPDDRGVAAALVRRVVRSEGSVERSELRLRGLDDEWHRMEVTLTNQLGVPDVDAVVCAARTVDERVTAAAELEHRALHDSLTQLPGRTLLRDRLELALSRRGTKVAVLFLDLDGFKLVNDSLGHGAGDAMLVEVARRILTVVRPEDTVARMGGDEFVIVLDGVTDDVPLRIAERIRVVVREPISIVGRRTNITASVGITIVDDAEDLDAVLRQADTALYRAKDRGRDRVEVFHPSMQSDDLRRLSLRQHLFDAVERGELALRHQPVTETSSGRIAFVESLVRLPRDGALVGPGEFVPVAAELGISSRLTRWVLRRSLVEAAHWRQAGWPVAVSVNVSPTELNDTLLRDVDDALVAAALDGSDLVLEVTEEAVVREPEAAREVLAELRRRGVRIALDDFGTGASALALLENLPLDIVKLDGSFLRRPAGRPSPVAAAVARLCRDLGLVTVAEGLETTAQLQAAVAMGYRLVQGFGLVRPVPAEEIDEWLALRGVLGQPDWVGVTSAPTASPTRSGSERPA